MPEKSKILIVEDEEPIRSGLIDVFVYHGFDVEFAVDGEEGLKKGQTGDYDLVILDVMLPKLSGFKVCERLRVSNQEQLIIMLTAKTTEEDIITGLASGADDYMSKPFSVRELVLRVQAVLRRSGSKPNRQKTVVIADLEIDVANLEAKCERTGAINFTRKELNVLLYLNQNQDRPVSREELLDEVWGYKKGAQIETRTVDIHIAKLRRKIEADHKNPKILLTIRGEGYRLRE